jgi:tetratricopeptide (TPR) repeat protein
MDDWEKAELEGEDDDILIRRRPRAASREAAGAATEPAPRPGVTRRAGRWVVVAGLLVGVAAGAWFAGRASVGGTAPVVSASPTAVATATAETVDAAARIAELDATLAAAPDDTDALLERGVLLFQEGDYAAAGEDWAKVAQLAPDNAAAWYNLGFYYLSLEPADTTAAGAAWDRVLELAPDSDMATVVTDHRDSFLAESEG